MVATAQCVLLGKWLTSAKVGDASYVPPWLRPPDWLWGQNICFWFETNNQANPFNTTFSVRNDGHHKSETWAKSLCRKYLATLHSRTKSGLLCIRDALLESGDAWHQRRDVVKAECFFTCVAGKLFLLSPSWYCRQAKHSIKLQSPTALYAALCNTHSCCWSERDLCNWISDALARDIWVLQIFFVSPQSFENIKTESDTKCAHCVLYWLKYTCRKPCEWAQRHSCVRPAMGLGWLFEWTWPHLFHPDDTASHALQPFTHCYCHKNLEVRRWNVRFTKSWNRSYVFPSTERWSMFIASW